MTIAILIGLVLESIAVLLQFLQFIRDGKKHLTQRHKRIFGHLLARMDELRALAIQVGIQPHEDPAGDAVIKELAKESDLAEEKV